MRKVKFQNDQYYHIYNRGTDKRDIFIDNKDYIRFLTGIREFNKVDPIGSLRDLHNSREAKKSEAKPLEASRGLASDFSSPLIEIISYCLNQNHYHLLLKQLTYRGIEKFMHKLGTSYTMYFNAKYNRSGSLFQGPFKAIHIKTDGHLMRLSCYINGNAEIHKISKAENWKWCGYPDYLGKRNGALCDKKIILNQFKNINEYKNLVDIIIKETKERKDEIKKYLLE